MNKEQINFPELLESLELTPKELAPCIGVGRRTVEKWKGGGKIEPKYFPWLKLVHYLFRNVKSQTGIDKEDLCNLLLSEEEEGLLYITSMFCVGLAHYNEIEILEKEKDPFLPEIGKNPEILRERMNWTLDSISQKFGRAISNIRRWEQSKKPSQFFLGWLQASNYLFLYSKGCIEKNNKELRQMLLKDETEVLRLLDRRYRKEYYRKSHFDSEF